MWYENVHARVNSTIQHGRDQRFLVGDWGDERREGESLFALLVLDTVKSSQLVRR